MTLTDWITPGQVADRIGVDAQQLADAVRDAYLPEPLAVGRGPDQGVERRWPMWVYTRAKYLFRLRKLGLRGDLLRLFLFLKDGKEWESVRSICLDGLEMARQLHSAPIKRHLRSPTAESVNFEIEEIARTADIKNVDFARLSLGVGQFGHALDGTTDNALAHFMPLADVPEEETGWASSLAVSIIKDSGLSFDSMKEFIETATSQQAEIAASEMRAQLRRLRRWSHQRREQPFTESHQSTNLLTFGQKPGVVANALRRSPSRLTGPKLMGAFVSLFVAFEASGLGFIARAFDQFAFLLRSEAEANDGSGGDDKAP